jgi:MSHA biogenesis protein MshP
MNRARTLQRGFAAIAAIFLVVVLAALGAFMVTFSNTQHLTSAQDVQGSRAYWVARAGLDWASGYLTANPTAVTCPGNPSPLEGFNLAVTCSAQTYSEGTSTVTILSMTAVAKTSGAVGSVGYIERSVSASMERQ